MLRPGDRAPDFSLENPAGARWSLGEALRGGPVAIAFFKVSCPTCQYTLPFLDRLIPGTNPDAPALIAISQDDAESTEKFRERLKLSFPVVLDSQPRFEASNLYRITHVPSIFLIERDGAIGLAFDGFEKQSIEELGRRFGRQPFTAADCVPGNRPG